MTLPQITPLRPTRSTRVPIRKEWIYELKLDGFRGLLRIQNDQGHFASTPIGYVDHVTDPALYNVVV